LYIKVYKGSYLAGSLEYALLGSNKEKVFKVILGIWARRFP